MKTIFTAIISLTVSFAALASDVKEKQEIKREVATSLQFKPKIYTGVVSTYKLMNEESTYLVTFNGEAAKTIWKSLKSTKSVTMGAPSPDRSKDVWYQKVSKNVTCDRVYDTEDKKSDYNCSISLVDGEAQGGAAG